MSSQKPISEMLVREIMSKQIIAADPATTLFQIAKMMEQGVGAIFVKKDSIPSGIITDRDFAIKIAVNRYPLDTTVDKVASFPLKTIASDQTILAAAKLMSQQKIRKIAVVENSSIVGIITSTDIVNVIASMKK